jgi:hypothetical protein
MSRVPTLFTGLPGSGRSAVDENHHHKDSLRTAGGRGVVLPGFA